MTEANAKRPAFSLAFGGGGLFGIAYLMGLAEALADGGVDVGTAPTIGTSAGSWAAAALGLGIRWSDAVEIIGPEAPRLPDPRPGRLRAVAGDLFGERRVPTMRAVMCSLPRLRRVVLSGADHAVADLVAASSAVPGILAPHKIDGTRYVDGNLRSMASADLADDADHLIVMAPIAGPMFGPGGRVAERVLRREMQHWQRDHEGGQLWLMRPNHAIAALARIPTQLFDMDRAKRCYDLSYAQGSGILARWATTYGG